MSAMAARRVLRLDDMPGTGPPCGGTEGVVAMGRVGVIAALGALLGLLGGVATAAPTLALADPARPGGGGRVRSVELRQTVTTSG